MSKNRKPRKWTLEKLKTEASMYSRRVDFQNGNTGAYLSARRRGLLNSLCGHMQESATKKYTDEEIIEIAKKFKTRSEFAKESKAYASAAGRGKVFLDKVCSHMVSVKKVQKHTKETAQIDSLKYKTKREWCLNDAGSYLASVKNGWVDDICQHMKVTKRRFPTYEEIVEAALRYGSKGEWDKMDARTYNAARKLKCLDKVCAHMMNGRKSGGESEILKIVKEFFPEACSKRFKNSDLNCYPLKSYELDIYIPELKKGIEFDGTYWHSVETLQKRRGFTKQNAENYHQDKDGFFNKQGIEVLHIKEGEWYADKAWIRRNMLSFLGLLPAVPSGKKTHFYRIISDEYRQELKELGV